MSVGTKDPGTHPTLLGVDISQPIDNAPMLRTLSLVNISSPNEGEQVSGTLLVTGVNNAFEGNSVIYLERNGKRYATTPATGGQGGLRLFPWRVTLDLTSPPGKYTLVAENDDASGQGRSDSDTRTVEVSVAQRGVRASRAATATTPAVEVRSTSLPRRTAAAPAR